MEERIWKFIALEKRFGSEWFLFFVCMEWIREIAKMFLPNELYKYESISKFPEEPSCNHLSILVSNNESKKVVRSMSLNLLQFFNYALFHVGAQRHSFWYAMI
jgi:hypothetical protein